MPGEFDYAEDAAHPELLLADRAVRLHVTAVGRIEVVPRAANGTPAAIAEFVHKLTRIVSYGRASRSRVDLLRHAAERDESGPTKHDFTPVAAASTARVASLHRAVFSPG